MWDHSGCIVTNAARLYYVPNQQSIPPLRWMPEIQQFVHLGSRSDEDIAMRTTLESEAMSLSACARPQRAAPPRRYLWFGGAWPTGSVISQVSDSTSCAALYGVLPICTEVSVLLYVTETEKVSDLTLGDTIHEVYLVRKMEWLRLPSAPPQKFRKDLGADTHLQVGVTNVEGEDTSQEKTWSAEEGSLAEEGDQLSDETISAYLRVVDQFCVDVSHPKGRGSGSHLYYSPTVNLSLSPRELLCASLVHVDRSRGKKSQVGQSTDGAGVSGTQPEGECCLSSASVFQWNRMLLDRFELPSAEQLHAELQKCSRSGLSRGHHRNACNASGHQFQWESVCMGGESGACAFLPSMLYIPCFIRGLVAEEVAPSFKMHLVTRLSCRWAGTRYNRRGLEPGWSGVTANMAISSLWVTQNESLRVGSSQRTFAVHDLFRGSIPRHWQQTADLTFKPAIKISSPSVGVEEVRSHVRLLPSLLPGIQRLCLVDTTSLSALEAPLSEAFASAVRKMKELGVRLHGTNAGNNGGEDVSVSYMKFNVKQKIRTMDYETMRYDLQQVIKTALEEDASDCVDFTRCEETKDHTAANSPTSAEPNARYWRIVDSQTVYHRVNCLDCLDRSNVVQSMLAMSTLPRMLAYVLQVDEGSVDTDHLRKGSAMLRRLYAAQGAALSQLYASSDPHFLNYLLKQKESFVELLYGGVIALRRWYHQNFLDGIKQDAISLVTRQHDPSILASEIESPFSRDLSSMNWQVVCGLFFAFVPLVFSLMVTLLSSGDRERKIYLLVTLGWITYLVVVQRKLSKCTVTFTNRPLLSH